MKIVSLIIVFLFLSHICHAQFISVNKPIYKIVKRDTINIRGKVYTTSNRPVPFLQIISKNDEYVFAGLNNYTTTDSLGKFILNGALIKDTLKMRWNHRDTSIVNYGSRYLEICLPATNHDTSQNTSIELIAKRIIPKPAKSSFKVLTNASVADYYGLNFPVHIPARYSSGSKSFKNTIISHIIYPEKAIQNNIEGDVEIAFTIKKESGRLTDFHVIRGIGYGCEEVVINALKNCPNWDTGMDEGQFVDYHSSIIINFRLTDK